MPYQVLYIGLFMSICDFMHKNQTKFAVWLHAQRSRVKSSCGNIFNFFGLFVHNKMHRKMPWWDSTKKYLIPLGAKASCLFFYFLAGGPLSSPATNQSWFLRSAHWAFLILLFIRLQVEFKLSIHILYLYGSLHWLKSPHFDIQYSCTVQYHTELLHVPYSSLYLHIDDAKTDMKNKKYSLISSIQVGIILPWALMDLVRSSTWDAQYLLFTN